MTGREGESITTTVETNTTPRKRETIIKKNALDQEISLYSYSKVLLEVEKGGH